MHAAPGPPASACVPALSPRAKGVCCAFFGIMVLTPDTLLLRLSENFDEFTILFYKFTFFAIVIMLYTISSNDFSLEKTFEKFRRLKRIGFGAGILWGASNILFVCAVKRTAVANVLTIIAMDPVVSTLLSILLLGEKVRTRTYCTILACIGALLLVFASNFSSGGSAESVLGCVFALLAMVSMATYFVLLRMISHGVPAEEAPDTLQCNVVAGVTVSVVSVIVQLSGGCDFTAIAEYPGQAYLLFLQGIVVLPVSFGLITLAPSFIPANEVSLYCLLETVIGPLFVWAAGYEVPPTYTVYGAAILVVALAANGFLSLREGEESVEGVELKISDSAVSSESKSKTENRIENKIEDSVELV